MTRYIVAIMRDGRVGYATLSKHLKLADLRQHAYACSEQQARVIVERAKRHLRITPEVKKPSHTVWIENLETGETLP